MRQAEFDHLFIAGLRTVDRIDPVRLRLVLDPQVEPEARDLTRREAACCSFFTFTFERVDDDLSLGIEVPPSQAHALEALARWADTLRPRRR